jgi:hypothetical protein
MKKTYLGDGLFANFDGYHIVLTAENGIEATNTVYLEPAVYAALVRYHAQLQAYIARVNSGAASDEQQQEEAP